MNPVTEYRIEGQYVSVAAYSDTLTFEGPIVDPKTLKPATRWERIKIAFRWAVCGGMWVEMSAFMAYEDDSPHPRLIIEHMHFSLRRQR